MDSKKRRNLIATGTYILVSFGLIAVISVGMITSLRRSMPPEVQEKPPKTVIDEVTPEPKLPVVPEIPVVPEMSSIPENDQVFGSELVPEEPEVQSSEEAENVPAQEKILYVVPVDGEIIKDFSNDSLVFSETMKDYRTHAGIDIACEYGCEVKCFTDGVIESFEKTPLNGMVLTVKHEDGLITRYCNLSGELAEGIEVGSNVRAGDCVAYVGDSGILECAEPVHLHFEIEKNGVATGLSDFETE
ncbi:MAG: M23 family metallopeptidase [Clostridia bacterium]|nr:M23 family metallopeptidase [Clostridia bacterium]